MKANAASTKEVTHATELIFKGTTSINIGEVIAVVYASPAEPFSKVSIRFVGLDHNDNIHVDVSGNCEFKAFIRFNVPLRIFDTFITPVGYTDNYGIEFELESIIPEMSLENSKMHQFCKGDYRAFKIRPD